jgi:hypothetical protein
MQNEKFPVGTKVTVQTTDEALEAILAPTSINGRTGVVASVDDPITKGFLENHAVLFEGEDVIWFLIPTMLKNAEETN